MLGHSCEAVLPEAPAKFLREMRRVARLQQHRYRREAPERVVGHDSTQTKGLSALPKFDYPDHESEWLLDLVLNLESRY
eukprot:SAG11_NODE_2502_length_3279_cov_1.547627_1_plen_79_part_00